MKKMRNKILLAFALILALSSCVKETIHVSGITLDSTSMTLVVGESDVIVATLSPADAENQNIIWSSENASVARVNGGTVTASGPGVTNIVAKSDDNGLVSAVCRITVVAKAVPVEGISLSDESIELNKGEKKRLEATISPAGATIQNVRWMSTDENVATVSESGEVSALGTGETEIVVTTVDGGFTASCCVSVVQSAEGLSLDKTELELYESESCVLTAVISPSDATDKTVEWTSSDESVATVFGGKVQAMKEGTAVITAKSGAFEAYCEVTVKCRVKGVSLSEHTLTLISGDTYQLKASVYPERADDRSVEWSSDKTSVVSVSGEGLLTALSPGSATISVKTLDGSHTDECKVTVKEAITAVTGIVLSSTELVLSVGKTGELTAEVKPAGATNTAVRWESTNPTVASVEVKDGKCTVNARSRGEAVICATTEDGGYHAYCKVAVKQPITSISLRPSDLELRVGDNAELSVTVEPSVYDDSLVWSSSDPAVATVDQNGKVTAVSEGSTEIRVKAAGSDSSSPVEAVCRVTVENAVVKVTGVTVYPTSLSLYVGDSETLTATVSPASAENKAVSWKSSNSDVASVNASGRVNAINPGTTDITVTTADGGYTAVCRVTVLRLPVGVTSITVSPNTLTLSYGESSGPLKVEVFPENADNTSVTWTSSDPTVATVSNSGEVTAKSKSGEAVITATSVANPSQSASCTVTVVPQIVKVTGISVTPSSLRLYLGQTGQLTATVSPNNATDQSVTWSAQQGGVASVSQTGVVTPLKVGSTRILARTNDGGYERSVQVTVEKNNVGTVKLAGTTDPIVLKVGETYELTAEVTGSDTQAPASNPAVRWTSSSSSYVSVEALSTTTSGNVTTVTCRLKALRATDSARVTVTSNDDSSKSASCTVKVIAGGSSSGGNEGVDFDDWNF